MTPHWTDRRDDLEQWLELHPRILLGCDFDGTLSHVAPRAGDAVLLPGARAALNRLVGLPGMMVAVVSGRALSDVRQRVGMHELMYVGNHGLEILGSDGLARVMADDHCRPQLEGIMHQLSGMFSCIPGVWIEDKQLTASIHYRQVEVVHHRLVNQIVRTAMHGVAGLEARQGKCVTEIRPAGLWNKGTAFAQLMKSCGVPPASAAFVGDDVTDLDAFAVVTDGWAAVVGELAGATADLWLRDPEDVAGMLGWMADVRLSAF